jgi:hypothetical protein
MQQGLSRNQRNSQDASRLHDKQEASRLLRKKVREEFDDWQKGGGTRAAEVEGSH